MRKLILFTMVVLAASSVSAAISDFYVIPAAAHTAGANGTMWLTDVAIQNIQSSAVTIEIALVASGEGLSDNVSTLADAVTVPANGSVVLHDVLAGRDGQTGALLIGGDKPFALTSRTYNQTANGTFGQTVAPAIDIASNGDDSASTLFIPGLVSNAAFRTNIGVVIVARTAVTVAVIINDSNGAAVGTRNFNVPAGATTHVQFSAISVGATPFDSGGAVVHITSGEGTAVAYASVVDNVTGDANFISGGTAATTGATALRSLMPVAMTR